MYYSGKEVIVMKLYSRKQVAIACSVLAVLAIGVGSLLTAWVILPNYRIHETWAPATARAEQTVTPVQYTSVTPSVGVGDVTADELNNIQIYNRDNKAVVYITTTSMQYTWFYQAVPQQGTGSGVIIDQLGHVLTNYHVIKGADKISITLADGAVVDGKVTGYDPENDLAVLQFDPKGKTLITIAFADSAQLQVGQKVLAIGNPFGFDRTLTTGIVSGLARPLQTEDGYIIRQTIQTDAAINPGNSGGPLLDSHGDLIGINSAIISPSGASAGVGFAIPSNTAKRIGAELISYGAVRRGAIDITPVDLFPALVDYFNLSVKAGVLISQAGPTAKQAGLRGGTQAVRAGRQVIYGGGDVIIAINGQPIAATTDLYNALEDTKPGELVEVKIMRGNQARTVSVKLIEATTSTTSTGN
jgi:S1-C subfamily serine protease